MNPPVVPAKPDVVMPTSPPTFQPMPVVTPFNTPPQGSSKNRKILFALLGIVILTITTISGFLLVAKPVLFNSNAWNCGEYSFALSSAGVVSVTNGSTTDEALQRANLYINNQLIDTYDVPALTAGASATLGTATLPTTSFTWQITGTSDCSNSGRVDINPVQYQCQQLKAFTADGTSELTAAQLAALDAGTTIRLVAIGTGSATNYTAVKFTVNGTVQTETTTKMASGDYYSEYTIPPATKTFTITAQLKGSDGTYY